MLKFQFLKYNEAGDGDGTGAPANKDETTPPAQKDPPSDPPPKKDGDTDEYGYAKIPEANKSGEEGAGEKKEGEKPSEKTKEEEKPEPVSGYSDEPPKTPDAGKQDDPPPKADEKKVEGLEFDLDIKDLDQPSVEILNKFFKEHKLSKEQAQALVDIRKAEVAANSKADNDYIEQQKAAVIKQKQDWHSELKKDPNFGGENFAKSINRVDKFLNEMMGDTKKVLTERKSMLPPYVMKDLLRVANLVYDTDKFVNGNKVNEESKETKEVSPLDYYT